MVFEAKVLSTEFFFSKKLRTLHYKVLYNSHNNTKIL